MVFVPPRAGKSLLVSEMFPAFTLGRAPSTQVVMTTYGQDPADTFGRKVRDQLLSPTFADLFPNTKLDPSTTSMNFIRTTAGGYYLAVGAGGPLTSKGADIAIVDDPVKDAEEADSALQRQRKLDWYLSVLRTRLSPGAGIILVQTRWHPEDLAGSLLSLAEQDPSADQWLTYKFPAIATEDEAHRKKGEALHPERYPLQELEKIKATYLATGRARLWASLYQQSPYVETGGYFRKEWFRRYTTLPTTNQELTYYIGTDYAVSKSTKADHTAILVFAQTPAGDTYILPDYVHAHLDASEAVSATLRLASRYRAVHIAVEKGVIEQAMKPEFERQMVQANSFTTFKTITRTQGKHIVATPYQARLQAGKIFIPTGQFWDETFIPEHLAFIPGANNKHDNLIDAAANFCQTVQAVYTADDAASTPTTQEDDYEQDDWEAAGITHHHQQKRSRIRSLFSRR